jgi:hypothetical protein
VEKRAVEWMNGFLWRSSTHVSTGSSIFRRVVNSSMTTVKVHQFLKEHLLHWLEALSWMRKVSEGIHAITSLESIALLAAMMHHRCMMNKRTNIGREKAVVVGGR